MKKNIKKREGYWHWVEYCDRCGKEICDTQSKIKPQSSSVDFCIHCLKYFFTNNVPYSFAVRLYRNNRENKK